MSRDDRVKDRISVLEAEAQKKFRYLLEVYVAPLPGAEEVKRTMWMNRFPGVPYPEPGRRDEGRTPGA